MTLRFWRQSWNQWNIFMKIQEQQIFSGIDSTERQMFSLCGLTDLQAKTIIDSGNWLKLNFLKCEGSAKSVQGHDLNLNLKMPKNSIKQRDGNGNLIGNAYCMIKKKLMWCKENVNDRQWQKLKECIETFKKHLEVFITVLAFKFLTYKPFGLAKL